MARRQRVRASWARRSLYGADRVETVFFVGLPSADHGGRGRLATQAAVDAESRQFGDIVQVDIVDSYRYYIYLHRTDIHTGAVLACLHPGAVLRGGSGGPRPPVRGLPLH